MESELMRDVSSIAGQVEGGWISTFSGRKFYPLTPRPEDVCIEDIAHALSMVCRYGGHTRKFYSVAEHSVLVTQRVMEVDPGNTVHALQALLHDAAEAYLCDVPRPVKHNIIGYTKAEEAVDWAIGAQFGIIIASTWMIKQADNGIIYDEALALMNNTAGSNRLGLVDDAHMERAPGIGAEIRALRPEQAEAEFLELFHKLNSELNMNC